MINDRKFGPKIPVPVHTITWPDQRSPDAQIQQIQAAGLTQSSQAGKAQLKSANTQGVPKVVSNISIQKKILTSTTMRLSVSFQGNSSDPYFASAVVYLKYGTSPPIQVTQGSISPLIFTVTRNKQPVTVIVTSTGNWGSTPVAKSPSKSVSIF